MSTLSCRRQARNLSLRRASLRAEAAAADSPGTSGLDGVVGLGGGGEKGEKDELDEGVGGIEPAFEALEVEATGPSAGMAQGRPLKKVPSSDTCSRLNASVGSAQAASDRAGMG